MNVLNFFLDNVYLVLMAVVSGALLLWPLVRGGGSAGKVSTAEAVRLINRERAVLIDVSEPAQYAAGHAAGAKNIPFSQLATRTAELPKNKTLPLVLLCANGGRAGRGVAVLQQLGYSNACALAGGLTAWREASLPFEKST